MPILAVVGITETGECEVLAFHVGDREHDPGNWNTGAGNCRFAADNAGR